MADRVEVTVKGMDEILARMQKYPAELAEVQAVGMNASLAVLWESVPPYPPEPEESAYRRTGTLGRTLGSSMSGGSSGGKPDIYTVKKLGSGMEGRFGSSLDYADKVIGDNNQAWMHKGRWWVISAVAEKAKDKIVRVWQGIADNLAAFLDGRG